MFFSIIIPVYNTKKYLIKCLESIRTQTYKNFEAILIDDGSTDDSSEICDYYSELDQRFTVVHKNNEGQGVARNIGIQKAKGNYIIFVDSDDWINPNLLEYLSHIIVEKNPDVIIYSVQFVSELKVKFNHIKVSENVNEKLLNKQQLWEKIFIHNAIIGGWVWNKCIKKELFNYHNLSFPAVRAREDAFLCAELFQKVNKIIITNYIGYYQLFRYGSTEQRLFSRDFLLSIRIAEMKLKFVQEEIPDLFMLAYKEMVKSKITALNMMLRDGREKRYKKEYLDIKNSLKDDLTVMESVESCSEVINNIRFLQEHPYRWKLVWKFIGIKTYFIRLKRCIYARYI